MSSIDIKLSSKIFNKKLLPYINNDSRYLIFWGGAGSGKSFTLAQFIIYYMLSRPKFNLLVVRNTGKSNRDSTYALLKQIVIKWKLSKYFKCNESDLRIKCLLNDNEIIFAGLDDVEKLKSITFSKGELTNIWIEEASEILEADFNQLDVRLRGKGVKKQIFISFNPIDINHWLKKRFFDKKDDNVCVVHSTYLDNDFLDSDYKRLLESYKDTDEYYYNVYCLGNWGVLGKTVFDAKKIQDRINVAEKPLKVGYFMYDYDGLKITNIRFVNDPNGYIKIYDIPQFSKYCIGCDTAGEGSDYFVGQVLDAKTGKQVAVLRNQFDSDLFTKQIYCLGVYYKKALIGIESNFDSFPIMELTRLGYDNQYVREHLDTYTGKTSKSFGFKTTSLTRPTIISKLIEIVREHTEVLNDIETMQELLTIIRNEKGRIEAPIGGHDDMMMSLAIAYHIKDQVLFNQETITPEFKEFFSNEKEETNYDYGERIQII